MKICSYFRIPYKILLLGLIAGMIYVGYDVKNKVHDFKEEEEAFKNEQWYKPWAYIISIPNPFTENGMMIYLIKRYLNFPEFWKKYYDDCGRDQGGWFTTTSQPLVCLKDIHRDIVSHLQSCWSRYIMAMIRILAFTSGLIIYKAYSPVSYKNLKRLSSLANPSAIDKVTMRLPTCLPDQQNNEQMADVTPAHQKHEAPPPNHPDQETGAKGKRKIKEKLLTSKVLKTSSDHVDRKRPRKKQKLAENKSDVYQGKVPSRNFPDQLNTAAHSSTHDPEVDTQSNNNYQTELTDIDPYLYARGKQRVPVEGDGHCLLYAFATSLRYEGLIDVTPYDLCEKLYLEIYRHLDFYQVYSTSQQNIIEEIEMYITDKRFDNDTGDLVIAALCNSMHVTTTIYLLQHGNVVQITSYPSRPGIKSRGHIYVTLQGNGLTSHYDSVIPLQMGDTY